MPRYELIPIECLLEPQIPAREAMDETKLAELADSVREIGFIHPLAVVPNLTASAAESGQGETVRRGKRAASPPRYEIVDGHRRYKVGVMLAHANLPCLIFDDAEKAREAVKLHANLYREDLSTAEEAAFIVDLINKYDYTEEQLCRVIRQKPSWINERLALIRGNMDVFGALRERKINLAVAKQLNRVKDDAQVRYFLSIAIEGGATALTVGRWVTEFLTKGPVTASTGQAAPVVDSPVNSTPSGVACFLCGREGNPWLMENVWIHPWEKQMLLDQIERSTGTRPGDLANGEAGAGKAV